MPVTHRPVPGLGTVDGLTFSAHPNVEQYRGIPYGSVPARFRQSKLATSWPDKRWDGTRYGPLCPFPKFAIGSSIVQKPLPQEHGYLMDEFRCLNANITCPKGAVAQNGYPVAVWIHGGANCMGTGADAVYNGAPLVDFAVQQGLPIVFVSINYRLGAFGFLASDDIREDNALAGDRGAGNYGIRDQLLALEWVKKYIDAFGGDPNNITAVGQSAGSVDIHIAMCSELFGPTLLFNQVILQSGVAPLTVRGFKHQQAIYEKIANHVGVDMSLSAPERLQVLRDVPADELVKSYIATGSPAPSWQATVDGNFLKTLPTYLDLSSQKYAPSIKRILLGDCVAEGTIWSRNLDQMAWTYEKLQALMSKMLGPKEAADILDAYEITPDRTLKQTTAALVSLLTDAQFSQPIQDVARAFSNGDVFYYHMREGNPFDGPNKSIAHHAVDLLFPFLTYQEHLSEKLQRLAETMARQWLLFINGEQPWKPYLQDASGTSAVMFFGPNAQATEAAESARRLYRRLALVQSLQNVISDIAAQIRGETIISG